jgi:phosphatidylserine synthase
LNIGNEIFYLIGMVIVSYLVLHYNVAFIETISNGLQPILAFFMVFLAYKFLPDIYIRNYKKKELIGKLSLCIITFLLLFIFYRVS